MELGLTDRVAIVTGFEQRHRQGHRSRSCQEHAKITICAREEKQLRATEEEIKRLTGSDVLALKADVKEKSDAKRLVSDTITKYGRIDVLLEPRAGFEPATFRLPERFYKADAFQLSTLSLPG